MFSFSLTLAIAPAILLAIYFYKKDPRPEPKKMIVLAFILGFVVVIILFILFSIIDLDSIEKSKNPWVRAFLKSFVTASFIEELFKFLVFAIFIFNSKYFDEISDGIIYMAIISLGFACLENIIYSFDDIITGFIRAFTAVPGHALWSGIMGYYFGLAKFSKHKVSLILVGLFIGILYHGLYDFVIFASIEKELANDYFWMSFLIVPLLIIGFFHIHRLLKKAKKMDDMNISSI